MNRRSHRLVVLGCLFALAPPSSASAQEELRVLLSAGFAAPYSELVTDFEMVFGVSVSTGRGGSVGPGPNTIPSQIRRGVAADVVILAREGLDQIIEEGRIVPGTDVDLASSVIGVAVRAGAPKPDISSVEALREALLGAASVSVSTSTSGRYLTEELFPRLGIADEMAPKLKTSGAAGVINGDAELGLQQVSEILALDGADLVGALPDEVQYVTMYSAAIVEGSSREVAARQLIALLTSEAAAQVIRTAGMVPAGSPGAAPR